MDTRNRRDRLAQSSTLALRWTQLRQLGVRVLGRLEWVAVACALLLGFGLGVAVGAGSVEGPAVCLPGFFTVDFWRNVGAGVFMLVIDIPVTVFVVQRLLERNTTVERRRAWLCQTREARGKFRWHLQEAQISWEAIARTIHQFKVGPPRYGPHWSPTPGPETERRLDELAVASDGLMRHVDSAVSDLYGDVPGQATEWLNIARDAARNLARICNVRRPFNMARADWWLMQLDIDGTRLLGALSQLRQSAEEWRKQVPDVEPEQGPLEG